VDGPGVGERAGDGDGFTVAVDEDGGTGVAAQFVEVVSGQRGPKDVLQDG